MTTLEIARRGKLLICWVTELRQSLHTCCAVKMDAWLHCSSTRKSRSAGRDCHPGVWREAVALLDV